MKQARHTIRWFSVVLSSLILSAASDSAAQSVWTPTTSGNWGDSLNWLGGVPTIELAATITNAGTKVITISAATPVANRAARRLDLNAPAGYTTTLRMENLGGSPFQLTNSFTLDAGSRLELVNSVLLVDGTLGGSFNQFAGDITLAGGSLITTNGAGLRIGRAGVGRATVSSGTMAAQGDLVVGGLAGSDGTLTQSNGFIQVRGQLTVGDDPGAVGRVNVLDGAFVATNATARIGDDGDGSLIQLAGSVIMDGVSIGRGSNSIGRLTLRGGVMQPGSVSVGRFANSQGTLEVSGGTLDLASSSLYIGREGAGTAVFSNGLAQVATVIIAASNTAAGTLQLRGGSLSCGQLIAVQPSAQIQFSSGALVITQATTVANGAAFTVGNGTQSATLQLDGGTHTFANGIVVSANATLKGTGTVVGSITVLPGGSNQMGTAPAAVTLSPAFVNGQFRFSFPSATGKLYDVLAAANLASPVWQLQTTLVGTGAPLTYTNNAAAARFFRVWVH